MPRLRCLFIFLLLFLLTPSPTLAATTHIHEFSSSAAPFGALISSDDILYGMTSLGGSGNGSIFSINKNGTNYTTLYNLNSSDGVSPRGSLLLSDGVLYGMARSGGSDSLGTIFSLNTDGTNFTVLHNFTGGTSDGANPEGSLIIYGSNLYGMTRIGGDSDYGTIFSISTNGTGFTLLHEFTGDTSDGGYPYGDLTLVGTKLYGMTNSGGSGGIGTIFSINSNGSGFSLMHSFEFEESGSRPKGSLTYANGILYGATSTGGSNNSGGIFSINPDGSGFTSLYAIPSGRGQGASASSLYISGTTMYGTTYGYCGYSDYGCSGSVIYQIDSDGSDYTELYEIPDAGGYTPLLYNSLIMIGNKLYGMSPYGGADDAGVIFSLTLPDTSAPALSLTSITDPTTDTTPSLGGTATDASGTVTDVEFQMDSTSGSWTNCVADDGTFDEASESFTCTVVSALSDGSHTMYVRATDDSSNVTDPGSYSSDTFTVAAPTPTPTPTSTPTSGPTPTPAPEKKEQVAQITSSDGGGGAVTAIQEGSTDTQQKATAVVETGTLKGFDAYLSSSAGSGSSVVSVATFLSSLITSSISSSPGGASGSTFKPPVSNAFVVGGDNGVLALKLPTGIAWGIGSPQQLFFKTLPPAGSDLSGAVIIPQLQQKPSIVALSYTNSDLIPPGDPTHPFNPKTLKLAHSLDGITWKILPTSVVDTQNKTVAALDKIYGWYMIVSPSQFAGRNTFTTASTLGATTSDETMVITKDTDVEIPKKVEEAEKAKPHAPAKEQLQPASFMQKIVNFVKELL